MRRITPLLNLPALGRCQSVYRASSASHRPVFLLNSRMSLFTVISHRFGHEGLHGIRHPFFRSYGAKLPSSLTRGHSNALVCSTCLPVSVCGTSTDDAPSTGFLGSRASASLSRPKSQLPIAFHPLAGATGLDRDIHHPDGLAFCVTVERQTRRQWLPNVNGMSIAYVLRPRLRIDSPWVD